MSTMKQLQLILPRMLAAALSIAPLPAAAAHAAHGEACLDQQKEDKLKAREVALLGQSHAEEHAETRARRCQVALGLLKEGPANLSHRADMKE